MANESTTDGALRRPAGAAAAAYRWVVAAGVLVVLGINLPGHLSFDSVVQLYEGRTGEHISFNPPIMAWIMGRFDQVAPGTGLYVAATSAVFGLSLLGLARLRPRVAWLGVLTAAAIFALPQVLLYQAIVWKDVLFANLALAGFVCVALAVRDWARPRARLLPLAAALLLFAVAALARQNGLICAALAALALAWTARGRGLWVSAAWAAAWLVAVVLLSGAIGNAVQPRGSTMAADTDKGLRVLQHYDIVGAVAHDPAIDLAVIARASPEAARRVHADGPRVYTPERVDTLARDAKFPPLLWGLPPGTAGRQWREILREHPGAYLAHRLQVFRWLVAPPDPQRCLPFYVGVDGPVDRLTALRLPSGIEPQDEAISRYARDFVATPAFSHLAYGGLAVVLCLALLWRGQSVDVVVAAMLLSALGFSASFFVISVACDYRYLYFLDLSALAGLVYFALDPTISRRRAT